MEKEINRETVSSMTEMSFDAFRDMLLISLSRDGKEGFQKVIDEAQELSDKLDDAIPAGVYKRSTVVLAYMINLACAYNTLELSAGKETLQEVGATLSMIQLLNAMKERAEVEQTEWKV